MRKQKQNLIIVALFAIVLCLAVFGGLFLTRNLKKSNRTIATETAEKQLTRMVKNIDCTELEPTKAPLEYTGNENTGNDLPDINTCAINAGPKEGEPAVEIWTSPEKSGKNNDGWLTQAVKDYNKSASTKIRLRTVNSGQAVDYISSGKATPDGFTPSAKFWGDMLKARNIQVDTVSDNVVKNTVGILLNKQTEELLTKDYSGTDLKSITQAVSDGKIKFGYTDPFASTGGLNLLLCTLQRYDAKNPLSEQAVKGFTDFQKNIQLMCLTTIQMTDAAKNGTLDAFIMERQSYETDTYLKKNYTFIPYGYRHDNPMLSITDHNPENKEVLKDFTDFCLSKAQQEKAADFGFNQKDDEAYACEYPDLDGTQIANAQMLYKQNKNNSNPIAAFFVADLSLSMNGDAIQNLKKGLLNTMPYINSINHVGLITYSDFVYLNLPLGVFDNEQQMKFKGTVESFQVEGNTATFDATCIAMNELLKYKKQHPEVKPMIFLLSDGETNVGYSLGEIKEITKSLQIPIYTINYNQKSKDLVALSKINEAECLNANTDDIVYQLKTLFNANL